MHLNGEMKQKSLWYIIYEKMFVKKKLCKIISFKDLRPWEREEDGTNLMNTVTHLTIL